MGKTIQQAVDNLRVTASGGTIGQRYQQGIEGADWASATNNAQTQANWGTGVQEALANGRYLAGVARVSNQDWRTASISKGVSRIGPGIIASLTKYQTRFAPILSAMNNAAASLPPRTTSATQNVTARLLPIIAAAQQASGKTPS